MNCTTHNKKFHLSLKKNRQKKLDSESCKENNSALANRDLDIYDYENIGVENYEDPLPSSQSFRLRLSEESAENVSCYDAKYKNDNQNGGSNTTVSIGDSDRSSVNYDSPLKSLEERKKLSSIYPAAFNQRRAASIIVIESSDSEDEAIFTTDKVISLDSDEDSVLKTLKINCFQEEDVTSNTIGTGWRRGASNSSGASSATHFSGKNNIISETSSSEEANKDFGIIGGDGKSGGNKSKVDSSPESEEDSFGGEERSARTNNLANVTCRSTTKPYGPVKLTKKDAAGLLKGFKLGNPYWTPKLTPTFSNLDTESNCSPGLTTPKVIDETKSDNLITESSSEDEIVSDSSTDRKPTKTHVTRFFACTPNQEKQYASLSDRKKKDISCWLMNNTPGSSSSSSIVSDSNRNSSFGNSSLERFELKHETPNNRGKISKTATSERTESVPRGIERFIYKGKTSVVKNQTPLRAKPLEENKIPDDTVTPRKTSLPVVKAVETLNIEDCADILDKLYGNVWRNKADAVFTPRTEPRVRNVATKKQHRVKTERKAKPAKGKLDISSSSDEQDFNKFAKDIRPNLNSTKKKSARDSFIDDKSSSANSIESFYLTALTNPRNSEDFRRRKPEQKTISASTRKAIEICDSDSETDENYPPGGILDKDLNRKRLSFSEDASNSSTSEFDPGELVLPKQKPKKAPAKTIHQTPKSCAADPGVSKFKSFLTSLSAAVPIQNCHPDAKIYRDNYKNKKEQLCRYLFQLYNDKIFDNKLPNDMSIEWNVRMRGTAGFCYNKKSIKGLGGVVRSSRIVLATKILDTPDRLRDTLVHEMCHAAAWLINNVSDGHGPYWKGWASKAVKTFPELPPIKRCHDYKIKTKYTYRCTKCGYSIGRHSKSLDTESKRCGHCYGKFELLINRTTRSGTVQTATPVQTRTPSRFALFVKENYHSVKKDRRSMKHAEVMRILGQQFAAVKIGQKPIGDVEK